MERGNGCIAPLRGIQRGHRIAAAPIQAKGAELRRKSPLLAAATALRPVSSSPAQASQPRISDPAIPRARKASWIELGSSAIPLVASAWTPLAGTFRIRLLYLSEIRRFPKASTAMPIGVSNMAGVASHPRHPEAHGSFEEPLAST